MLKRTTESANTVHFKSDKKFEKNNFSFLWYFTVILIDEVTGDILHVHDN